MKKFLVAILMVLAMAGFAYAEQAVTLEWTPPTTNADGSPCEDLAGFKLYCSFTSNDYTVPICPPFDAGNVTTAIITFADEEVEGRTVYFVATAYDTSGNESGYSNEVSRPFGDLTPPGAPLQLRFGP